MSRIVLALLLSVSLVSSPALAGPWAVVANSGSSSESPVSGNASISTIDLGTSPRTVYGPFLEGQLGTSWGGADVAVTPDRQYALVTNLFTVYRVDLSDPTNPTVAGSLDLGFLALDVSISPDGTFAFVTSAGGGLLPSNEHLVALIDLTTFSASTTITLASNVGSAKAVAIASDNKTYVIADYYLNQIIYGLADPTAGTLTENTLPTGHPINVAISPDGQTVLVPNFVEKTVSVFRIVSPGVLKPGSTPTIAGLPDTCSASTFCGPSSIAFNQFGNKAYVENSGGAEKDTLSVLRVLGPGKVALESAVAATLIGSSVHGAYIAVDTLSISPNGRFALAASTASDYNDISMINLSTYEVTSIADDKYPAGISFVPNSTVVYSSLGKRDRITFGFYGKKGERVSLRLEQSGLIPIFSNEGSKASLTVTGPIPFFSLKRSDRTDLPNSLNVTLPSSGFYEIKVDNVAASRRIDPAFAFTGDYSVVIESSGNAFKPLR